MSTQDSFRCPDCEAAFDFPKVRRSFGRCGCGGKKVSRFPKDRDGYEDRSARPIMIACERCGKEFPRIAGTIQAEWDRRDQAQRDYSAHCATAHRAKRIMEEIKTIKRTVGWMLKRDPTTDLSAERLAFQRLMKEWWEREIDGDQREILMSAEDPVRAPHRWKPGSPAWYRAIEKARSEGTQIILYGEKGAAA